MNWTKQLVWWGTKRLVWRKPAELLTNIQIYTSDDRIPEKSSSAWSWNACSIKPDFSFSPNNVFFFFFSHALKYFETFWIGMHKILLILSDDDFPHSLPSTACSWAISPDRSKAVSHSGSSEPHWKSVNHSEPYGCHWWIKSDLSRQRHCRQEPEPHSNQLKQKRKFLGYKGISWTAGTERT